jgi:hypothetical protein
MIPNSGLLVEFTENRLAMSKIVRRTCEADQNRACSRNDVTSGLDSAVKALKGLATYSDCGIMAWLVRYPSYGFFVATSGICPPETSVGSI